MRRYKALRKANITHVVSALALPLDRDLYANYKHLVVELDDMDDEDIIQHFATSNAFIKDGLKSGGGVLVHWYVQPKNASPQTCHAFVFRAIPLSCSFGVVIHLALSNSLWLVRLYGSCVTFATSVENSIPQAGDFLEPHSDLVTLALFPTTYILNPPESSKCHIADGLFVPVPWESHDPQL